MATALLVIIYLFFISLGVPDSLFGIIGRNLGVGLLPWYLLALFALMAWGVLFAAAKLDK